MIEPYWKSDDGRHVIYNADCLQVLPELKAGVDALVTDPPYEIVMQGGGMAKKLRYMHETKGFTDCGFDYQILSHFDNWACFGTLKQVPKLIQEADKRRWMLITWNKPNPTPLCSGNYLPDTEYIIHAWRKGNLHGGYRDKARFIVHPSGDTEDGTHPNEKPTLVMEKIVRVSSGVGGTILDPFCGSGTTGVACVRTNRRFIGIEIEKRYCDIAVKRIERELSQPMLPFAEPEKVEQATMFNDETDGES